jgi:hypothetical protein
VNSGYPGFGYSGVVFLILSFHFVNKILVLFKFRIVIILFTFCVCTQVLCVRSHFNLSVLSIIRTILGYLMLLV